MVSLSAVLLGLGFRVTLNPKPLYCGGTPSGVGGQLQWQGDCLKRQSSRSGGFAVSQVPSEAFPIVSIVVPFFGLTNSILRILKGNPKKERNYNGDYRFHVDIMRDVREVPAVGGNRNRMSKQPATCLPFCMRLKAVSLQSSLDFAAMVEKGIQSSIATAWWCVLECTGKVIPAERLVSNSSCVSSCLVPQFNSL